MRIYLNSSGRYPSEIKVEAQENQDNQKISKKNTKRSEGNLRADTN